MADPPTPERETPSPDPVEEAVESFAVARWHGSRRQGSVLMDWGDLPDSIKDDERRRIRAGFDALDSPSGRAYLLSRALTEEQ